MWTFSPNCFPFSRSWNSFKETGSGRTGGGAGGGGTITDQPPPPSKESKGEVLFKRMTKEAQEFFLWQRNNDLAAVYKTLEYADEGMLRKAGRFAN